MGQGGAVEHVHGEVGRRAEVQLDDPGTDVGGLVVGEGPIPGEVPGAGAGEEVERQPGADVDAVQLVGVLVAELAGDDPADVAAPGGVLLVSQGLGHQGVPEVGDLPEVDVRKAGERAGESEAGQGGYEDVERVGGVTAERGRVGERVDHLRPVPERPWPAVGEDQRDRVGAVAGLVHEVHRDTGDAHLVVLVGVDGGLGLAPVVVVPPVGDKITEIAVRDAVGPVPIPLVQRRTGQCETGVQVIEDVVGHVDRGGLQREGVQGGHGVVLLYWVGGSGVVGLLGGWAASRAVSRSACSDAACSTDARRMNTAVNCSMPASGRPASADGRCRTRVRFPETVHSESFRPDRPWIGCTAPDSFSEPVLT